MQTLQNTWSGQNYFTNPANQFSGRFNGSFAGDGSNLNNVPASGIAPGSFTGTFHGNAPTGTSSFFGDARGLTNLTAANIMAGIFPSGSQYPNGNFTGTATLSGGFAGTFAGVGSHPFTGDGSGLSNIPTLVGNNVWTGSNQFGTDTVTFTGDVVLSGPPSANINVANGFLFVGDYMECGSGGLGDIFGTIIGPMTGLTGFKSGATVMAAGFASLGIAFNSPMKDTNYAVSVFPGAVQSTSSDYWPFVVTDLTTGGFTITIVGSQTLMNNTAIVWIAVPFNNP